MIGFVEWEVLYVNGKWNYEVKRMRWKVLNLVRILESWIWFMKEGKVFLSYFGSIYLVNYRKWGIF